ncbi:MAG: hypothetical protein FJY10_09350 [Bacteroidetes bacterium]|nr:hypothetical protein [Bacteroidota bacterium]
MVFRRLFLPPKRGGTEGYEVTNFRAASELGIEQLQSLVFEVDVVMAKAMILHYTETGSFA